MNTPLSLQKNISLLKLNSFGIAAQALAFLRIENEQQLTQIRADAQLAAMPRLILGGGSNLVLSDKLDALVLQIAMMGKQIVAEDNEFVFVSAAAGETWHEFVLWTLQEGLGGMENLSLIPGTVGAAPIQNIGAYGVEMQDYFHHLTAFDFLTGEVVTLDKQACQFSYRDSIFKHDYRDRMVILNVVFALPKIWQPRLNYGDVAQSLVAQGISAPAPKDISEAIIAIRRSKLPDPAEIGNAGSFFKNPIVSAELRDSLLTQYPAMVSYAQTDGGYKLAAGWLIEQTGWKGKALGKVGVYHKQALVLVNLGGATGAEVRQLAQQIQADVKAKFGVRLEVEPVFA
ncbi:UDP-N-acetylmuramate dehydrogenase [Undibacterium parvum]|uniref:UDP-N-acetylenolpyruvoylglucosamine reductase n=1 Tax=Undibacterium parvum TaxID=401471 RepID=A0A3S9HMX8_9BURK|nr:UDP-N-acetylmuramate dehydrogenase [Undibacterium parvum]AZP13470.1 UDP-N-acetylmuramate dehydrogenase [Undibacterium parvum]